MVPLETPARSAIAWRRALASPHSPKTARAASMIWWGRSSGRLRHLGGADFAGTDLVLGIAKQIVTDQSVIYYGLAGRSITSSCHPYASRPTSGPLPPLPCP